MEQLTFPGLPRTPEIHDDVLEEPELILPPVKGVCFLESFRRSRIHLGQTGLHLVRNRFGDLIFDSLADERLEERSENAVRR